MDYIPRTYPNEKQAVSALKEIFLLWRLSKLDASVNATILRKRAEYYCNRLRMLYPSLEPDKNVYGIYFHVNYQQYQDREEMAKKFNTQFEQTNYRLDQAEIAQLPDYATKLGMTTEKMLEQICGDGYKVSMSYVFDSNAFVVTVTTTDNIEHTKNSFVTNWADNLFDAVLVAHYKLYVCWNGQAWFERQSGLLG